MNRIAMLSVHTCPLAMLGGKNTGGMNVYVRELSRELGRRGYEVDIFTRCENANIEPIIQMGPHVRVVHVCAGPPEHQDKYRLYEYLPEFASEVKQFAEQQAIRYDVLHSHYWLSGWVARQLQRDWHVPIVQMFHTLGAMKDLVARPGEPQDHPLRVATERELMQDVDRVIAATARDQKQMVSLYGANPAKMRIIPCGVDLDLFHPHDKARAREEIGIEPQTKMVLFVGRMEPLKGIDDLLHAIAHILDDHQMPCNSVSLSVIGGSAE